MDRPKQFTAFKALLELLKPLPKDYTFHITADKHFSNLNQAQVLEKQGFYFTLNCKGNA